MGDLLFWLIIPWCAMGLIVTVVEVRHELRWRRVPVGEVIFMVLLFFALWPVAFVQWEVGGRKP